MNIEKPRYGKLTKRKRTIIIANIKKEFAKTGEKLLKVNWRGRDFTIHYLSNTGNKKTETMFI